MALADVDRVTFAYPGAAPALRDVSLRVEEGEVIALLGASGSGKSTLLRALSGLVPHFHGGRFAGRVLVAGRDTREARPAELAGTVATLFQDPEDQVILTRVEAEIAFGLENLAVASGRIGERIDAALVAVDAAHLRGRRVAELSGGELQRVCIAAVLALEPRLLLLDEPSSQLDPEAAAALFAFARASGCAVVVAEQRPQLPLAHADRVVFMDSGEIAFDLPLANGIAELPSAWLDDPPRPAPADAGDELCRVERVSFAYRGGPPVLDDASLVLRRREIVALHGTNGVGKTTLAKLVSGLLRPSQGRVLRHGRPAYLSQDPGRYLFEETVLQEVCLAAAPDVARRMLASVGLQGMERRHPRDLSSGERERLAVACVLAVEPDILVLDEPTRGVDPLRKLELAELLIEQRGRRATLVVTHDLRFAAAVADRVVTLGGVTTRV